MPVERGEEMKIGRRSYGYFSGDQVAVPIMLIALLSLLIPLRLADWSRGDLLILYQTIFLFWTLAGAAAAVIFAGKSWQTALDALHVSNYLTLSHHWNEFFGKIAIDKKKRKLLTLSRDTIEQDEWEQAKPLVQEILTNFDAWLVQNELGAFPKPKGVNTWTWWWNTIIGYFVEYPLLIDVLRKSGTGGETEEYSPWLQEARQEAERLLAKGKKQPTG